MKVFRVKHSLERLLDRIESKFKAAKVEDLDRGYFAKMAPHYYPITNDTAAAVYVYEVDIRPRGLTVAAVLERWAVHHITPTNLGPVERETEAAGVKEDLNAAGVEAIAGGGVVLCSREECHQHPWPSVAAS